MAPNYELFRRQGMKKWLVAGGIIFILLITGYLILSFYAVKFIQPRLQMMMKPGLTVAKIEVRTTYLSAQKIEYEDPHFRRKILQIGEVRIYPDLFSFLIGNFKVRELLVLRPSLFFYRSRDGTFVGPWFPTEKREKDERIPIEKGRAEKGPSVEIDRIRAENGSIGFEDQAYGKPPFSFQLRELNLKLENVRYPIVSAPSPFELKGKMEGRTKEGKIEAKGWIDFQTTDTEFIWKVHDAEVKTFEPYYQKRVTAEIESGSINLEAIINLKQRKIDAPGVMELMDLRMKEEGTVFWVPAKTVVSLLKNKGSSIKAKFHVKGNMDDPKFNLQENILTQMAFSFGEALGLPVRSLGEMIMGGTGKESEGLSEGFRSMRELFRKKEKKK
jgi:hypothetical protein